jgi:hypothetical protein
MTYMRRMIHADEEEDTFVCCYTLMAYVYILHGGYKSMIYSIVCVCVCVCLSIAWERGVGFRVQGLSPSAPAREDEKK